MSADSMRKWVRENPERNRAYKREQGRRYRELFPEKMKAYRDAWLAKPGSAEKRKAARRRWAEANREKIRSQARTLYAKSSMHEWWQSKLLCAAKASSRRRGHAAPTITKVHLEMIWASQGGLCYWTGAPMNTLKKSPWLVSLDRMDNDIGYHPGNVVLCSWFANRARGNMGAEEFSAVLRQLRSEAKCIV